MRLSISTGSLALLMACSANVIPDNPGSKTGTDTAADSAASEPEDTSTIPPNGPAAWYGIDGVISSSDTNLSATLSVHFFSENHSDGPLCTMTTEASGLDQHEFTPDPTILYWASSRAFAQADTSTCIDADRLPLNLQLGIGSLHNSLIPILVDQGLEELTTDSGMYGAYIGFESEAPTADTQGTAFVLGYATLDNQDPDSDGISIDNLSGKLSVNGVFLFPLASVDEDTGEASTQ